MDYGNQDARRQDGFKAIARLLLLVSGAAVLAVFSHAINAAQHNASQAPSSEPINVGQATPTSRVNPSYPAYAQEVGLEGFVEVAFVIQRDGQVHGRSIRVTNSQPQGVFEDAVREAIAQWHFEPSDRLRNATQRIELQLR